MKSVTRKYRNGETGTPFPARIDMSTGELGRMPGEILGEILGRAGALDVLRYFPQETRVQAEPHVRVLNSGVYQVIPAKKLIGLTSLVSVDKASIILEEESDLNIVAGLLDASIIFTDSVVQGIMNVKNVLDIVVSFIQKHVTLNNGEINPALDLSILYSIGLSDHYEIPLGFAFGGNTMMVCDWGGWVVDTSDTLDTLDSFANSMAGLGVKNCIYMSKIPCNGWIARNKFEEHGIKYTYYHGSWIIPTKYNEALIRYMAANDEFKTEEDRKFMLGSIGLGPYPTSHFLNVSPAVESKIGEIYSWAIESDKVRAIHYGGRWSSIILENYEAPHAFSYVGIRVPRRKLEDAPMYMYDKSRVRMSIEDVIVSIDQQNAMSLDDLVKVIAGSREEGLVQFRTLMGSELYWMAKTRYISVVCIDKEFRYYAPS